MSFKTIIINLFVKTVVVSIMIFIFINMFFVSLMPTSKTSDRVCYTKGCMREMYNIIEYYLQNPDNINNLYLTLNKNESIEIKNNETIHEQICEIIIPNKKQLILNDEIILQIIKYNDLWTSFYNDGNIIDAWGQPIIIILYYETNMITDITMHSFGRNKKNDNGRKDDLVMHYVKEQNKINSFIPHCINGKQ